MQFFERESAIAEIVRGKRVLHLGCIGFADSDPLARVDLFQKSLHFRLSQIADVVGVDYAESVITQLQSGGHGMNIVVGDVEMLDEVPINGQFDIVLAGDIIEHIANPGKMLAGIQRFCGPETELVLTTPNAFGLLGQVRFTIGRFKEAREHVLSFNRYNLEQMLSRFNFKIVAIDTCYQHWVNDEHSSVVLFLAKRLFKTIPKWGGTLFVRAKLESAS